LIPLSARSSDALQALAAAYRDWLTTNPNVSLADLAYSTARRRSHHPHRLALVAERIEDLVDQLDTFCRHESRPGLSAGRRNPEARLAFVFGGMGPQEPGMARQLLEQEPVFREAVRGCDELLQPLAGWSLLAELTAEAPRSRMDEPQIAQPALFAVQVGLAALWRSWGVLPRAVIGHSVGEVAAAHVAGALALADAVRVIFHRSRLQQRTRGQGRMLAAGVSAAEAEELIRTAGPAAAGDSVTVAAINSPRSVTLCGDAETLEAIARTLEDRGIFCRFLHVDVPYHSPFMDQLRDELLASLAALRPQQSAIPLFSTVTGATIDGPALDAGYWWRNVRQPVLFAAAAEALLEAGYDTFLELGPHPVLASSVQECALTALRPVTVLASLRRRTADRASLLDALGKLYVLGFPVAWEQLYPGGQFLTLPRYPWQRERFWRESEEARQIRLGLVRSTCPGLLGQDVHPLLGRPIRSAGTARIWHVDVDLDLDHGWLADHRILGDVVFPAAAYLEAVLAAARAIGPGPVMLEDIEFHRPMILSVAKPQALELVVEDGQTDFGFYARGTDDTWTRLATGTMDRTSESPQFAPVPLAEVRQRCPREIDGAEWYRQLAQSGYGYGPTFQGVERIWCGDGEALALLRVRESLAASLADYLFHPAVLDSGLQVYQGTLPFSGEGRLATGTYVPQRAERVRCYRSLAYTADMPAQWYCHFHTRPAPGVPRGLSDVRITDETGQVLFEIIGLHSASIGGSAEQDTLDGCFYQDRWELQPRDGQPITTTPAVPLSPVASPNGERAGGWLLFADRAGVGAALAQRLEQSGDRVIRIESADTFGRIGPDHFEVHPERADDFHRLLHELRAASFICRGIVYLWSVDAAPPDAPAQASDCLCALHLVQACAATWTAPPRLYLVTRGIHAVGRGEVPAVGGAPLWGLGRVIRAEHPALRCTLIDMGPADSPDELLSLVEELRDDGHEDEIALRGRDRYIHRFVSVTPPELGPLDGGTLPASGHSGFRLEFGTPGLLESEQLREIRRRPPGPHEVEIEVVAAALNFKDVAKALNLLSDDSLRDTWSGRRLGMECAGRVTACGAEVRSFHAGDEVVAQAPGCLASHVLADARLVAPKPARLTFAEAVTFPVAFATAAHALHELAHLRPGERVLIHSAAGGVGLAAVQLAKRVGAEIFATAGNPEKRDFLRQLGIQHVYDSRTLDFAHQILDDAGGRGVDVVLNSLTGAAMARSLAVLASGGRFLELGKRDIEQNARLGLRPFQKQLAYFAIDLDRLWAARPESLASPLADLMREAADGTLDPLPHREFPISQARDAFQWMARARHIGKVVLSLVDPSVQVLSADELPGGMAEEDAPAGLRFPADATYLVTGGLGGFGLATARWLVERGARHLVLLGRSGAASTEAQQAVRDLEQAGARVLVARADVAQADQLQQTLDDARRRLPPLRGVFHAAMVLDDAILLHQTAERFRRVLAPKVTGAWNLHRLTAGDPLDYFVLFSSTAAVFGSAGQGNYAAANAFLDGLAHHRRALGLPGLSVNWPAVADVGYVAQHAEVRAHIERTGMVPLPSSLLLRALGVLLRRGTTQATVLRLDWSRAGAHALAATSPRFSHLAGAMAAPAGAVPALSLQERLRTATEAARRDLLLGCLREQVGKALGIAPAGLEPDVPLTEMGLESLLAVDLGLRLKKELGIDISMLRLLRGVTLNNLLNEVQERLAPGAGAGSAAATDDVNPPVARSAAWRAQIAQKGPRDFTLAVALGEEDGAATGDSVPQRETALGGDQDQSLRLGDQ
jgi:acyl transferase domain-containing protein/acyl carrier protein